MSSLHLAAEELQRRGAWLTASEILQQPQTWRAAQSELEESAERIESFLRPQLSIPGVRLILTGAGSSSFIGATLVPTLRIQTGLRCEAIATTDIVTMPEAIFEPETPTLIVSFSRSGGSPESVAALELGTRFVRRLSHLIVTANPEGALAQWAHGRANAFALPLPAAAHDQAFAMTTSFTTMLLATQAVAVGISASRDRALQAAASAERLLADLQTAPLVAGNAIRRIVFLGSNALHGIAREAALKVLELTDGAVATMGDSPVAFRHGPKTVLKDGALVVQFCSNDPYTRGYDLDLLRQLRAEGSARIVAISAIADEASAGEHRLIPLMHSAPDANLALPMVVLAQALAFEQSLILGLRADNPSVSGTVHRVVRGVTIHPYQSSG